MTGLPDERTPYYDEGLKWFAEEFRNLFSVPHLPNPFSENWVGCAYEGVRMTQMVGASALTMAGVARTARVANHFLDEGAKADYEKVARALFSVVESIPMDSNLMVGQRNAIAQRKDDGDVLSDQVLKYYLALYEGLSPRVLAPVVYAAQIKEGEDVQFPDDGKADLKFLHKMQERYPREEDRRLMVGRDRHVRNAIAHQRFELLDGDRVCLSEKDGRWSREFTLRQMLALCDTLWINSTAVSLGHAIFYANNYDLAGRMGLIPDDLPIRRSRDREELIRHEAGRWGFTVKELKCGADSTVMTLRTQQKGIPHPELQIFGDGSGRSARRYIDSRMVSVSVRVGVMNLLLTMRRASESGGAHVRVVRHDGQDIANVHLPNMKSVSEEHIESMNLGIPEEEKTWMEHKQVL